jgi:hypothetical protein
MSTINEGGESGGGGGGSNPPKYSPEMQKGLEILKKYAPDLYNKVMSGEVPLQEALDIGVAGGTTHHPKKIIVSADPNYPGSTASALYEEIYHFTHGHNKLDYWYELEAKTAMSRWILKNNISNYNPFTSGDIRAYKLGGVEALGKWITQEYGLWP